MADNSVIELKSFDATMIRCGLNKSKGATQSIIPENEMDIHCSSRETKEKAGYQSVETQKGGLS